MFQVHVLFYFFVIRLSVTVQSVVWKDIVPRMTYCVHVTVTHLDHVHMIENCQIVLRI